ncbi:MAG: hypothetical protein M1815_000767 [Lichina confinis]|nr:MAG: hypothetical protein M1815_000767 [Lichina confinis]
MMELVAPTIRDGGVDLVYVMPNLQPPIITVRQALDYQSKLEALVPNVTFLMTLFLHPSLTPAVIREAKEAGIAGVKSYPQGVTTNSSGGVVDYAWYHPVFAEMERLDVVLNLHGERPSTLSRPAESSGLVGASTASEEQPFTILTAEEAFLPTLFDLHHRFPRLRIVLEHCTTAAAVDAVRRCGPTVAATVTAHHLFLTVDDWAGDPFFYCKPVAKTPSDRRALLEAVVSGDPKFFFGSDSAPHPVTSKQALVSGHNTDQGAGTSSPTLKRSKPAAGIFTQKYATQLVLDALLLAAREGIIREDKVIPEVLNGFLSAFGRCFYRVDDLLHARDQQGQYEAQARTGEKEMIRIRTDRSTKKGGRSHHDADETNDGGSGRGVEDGKTGVKVVIQDILSTADRDIEVVVFRGGERTSHLSWETEVHIMHTFPHDFYGKQLNVLIMGFIRPEYDYVSTEALIEDIRFDIKVAKNSLDRDAWSSKVEEEFLLGGR